MKILGIDNNSKTVKGLKQNISTAIIYLAPSNASGVTNTCPSASKQCREACLFTAGRGRMNPIQEARINKTKFLVNEEEVFLLQLWKETAAHEKRCSKNNLFAAERLNGTSDLAWEALPRWKPSNYWSNSTENNLPVPQQVTQCSSTWKTVRIAQNSDVSWSRISPLPIRLDPWQLFARMLALFPHPRDHSLYVC